MSEERCDGNGESHSRPPREQYPVAEVLGGLLAAIHHQREEEGGRDARRLHIIEEKVDEVAALIDAWDLVIRPVVLLRRDALLDEIGKSLDGWQGPAAPGEAMRD